MTQRTLLFWSKRSEKLITDNVWQADRVIEVPDDISTMVADAVARRLTVVLHEELTTCKTEQADLRIIPIGPPAFQDILEHTVNSVITPFSGGLTIIRAVPRTGSPTVIIDHDTVNKTCKRFCDPDFANKPPDPDKRLYNDDLPATLEPPPEMQKKEKTDE
jgi:hypothetical protein